MERGAAAAQVAAARVQRRGRTATGIREGDHGQAAEGRRSVVERAWSLVERARSLVERARSLVERARTLDALRPPLGD